MSLAVAVAVRGLVEARYGRCRSRAVPTLLQGPQGRRSCRWRHTCEREWSRAVKSKPAKKSDPAKKSVKVAKAISKTATTDKPRKVIKPRARLAGTLSPAIRAILERTRVGRAELDGIIAESRRRVANRSEVEACSDCLRIAEADGDILPPACPAHGGPS